MDNPADNIDTLISNVYNSLNTVDATNVPPSALVMMECMKGIFELNKILVLKLQQSEDVKSVCENNTHVLKGEMVGAWRSG